MVESGEPAKGHALVPEKATRYDRVAFAYEWLGEVYSGGAIRRSKVAFLEYLEDSARVLFVGAGAGEDGIEAARRGHAVTLLDPSAGMLRRAARHAHSAGVELSLECATLEELDSVDYDVVCAHYFLNVFRAHELGGVVERLFSAVRPGGVLSVADFSPAGPGVIDQILRYAYYAPPALVFGLLCGNPLHPIYDYADVVRGGGFELVSRTPHLIFGRGPALYESLVCRRPIST